MENRRRRGRLIARYSFVSFFRGVIIDGILHFVGIFTDKMFCKHPLLNISFHFPCDKYFVFRLIREIRVDDVTFV